VERVHEPVDRDYLDEKKILLDVYMDVVPSGASARGAVAHRIRKSRIRPSCARCGSRTSRVAAATRPRNRSRVEQLAMTSLRRRLGERLLGQRR
jgi:hypothetical protein